MRNWRHLQSGGAWRATQSARRVRRTLQLAGPAPRAPRRLRAAATAASHPGKDRRQPAAERAEAPYSLEGVGRRREHFVVGLRREHCEEAGWAAGRSRECERLAAVLRTRPVQYQQACAAAQAERHCAGHGQAAAREQGCSALPAAHPGRPAGLRKQPLPPTCWAGKRGTCVQHVYTLYSTRARTVIQVALQRVGAGQAHLQCKIPAAGAGGAGTVWFKMRVGAGSPGTAWRRAARCRRRPQDAVPLAAGRTDSAGRTPRQRHMPPAMRRPWRIQRWRRHARSGAGGAALAGGARRRSRRSRTPRRRSQQAALT